MQYFNTIEGMFSYQFEQDGEKDQNGNLIKATEQPLTEAEYIAKRKEAVNNKLKRLANKAGNDALKRIIKDNKPNKRT